VRVADITQHHRCAGLDIADFVQAARRNPQGGEAGPIQGRFLPSAPLQVEIDDVSVLSRQSPSRPMKAKWPEISLRSAINPRSHGSPFLIRIFSLQARAILAPSN
jgi:hypothetical protein